MKLLQFFFTFCDSFNILTFRLLRVALSTKVCPVRSQAHLTELRISSICVLRSDNCCIREHHLASIEARSGTEV